jgi:hypothetical protein
VGLRTDKADGIHILPDLPGVFYAVGGKKGMIVIVIIEGIIHAVKPCVFDHFQAFPISELHLGVVGIYR